MDTLSPMPRCRKCQNPISPETEDDVLDSFGDFFRLRCTSPACGHIDWYRGVKFTAGAMPTTASPAKPAILAAQEPGDVWVHDVVLGLSFKAEGIADHNTR